MQHKFSVSFEDSYNRCGMPLIFIEVTNMKGFGFEFLIDTTTKYNWIRPDFIEFFTIEPETLVAFNADEIDISVLNDVFKNQGTFNARIKNNECKEFEKVNFNFRHEGITYSEMFLINPTLDVFDKHQEVQIVGILSGKFLKRNKWVIDYNQLLIYRDN